MRPLVALILGLAVLAPAAGAMDMAMGSPEHVAAALTALKAGHDLKARHALHAAVTTDAEPAAARHHASAALKALGDGHRAAAIADATKGAAVEHLTYALSAVEAKHDKVAADHLMEATELAPVASDARTAQHALKTGHRATAIRYIRMGLEKVG